MTNGWLNSVLVRVGPVIIAGLMRLWLYTCRVHEHNNEHIFKPDSDDRQAIATFWHNNIIYVFYHFRKYRVAAMVSASRDGEYVARVAARFGFKAIRGSRNQRGMQAFKGMLKALKEGYNCAIVADGSQGPPRKVQAGAVLLGAKMQVPIFPMAWSASRYWVIRSWDRTIIPKPFATIELFHGAPLQVPADVSAEELEKYRLELEKRLNVLYTEAWKVQGRAEH